ncbi:LysR family transcriptional regulator [Pelagibius sp. Alg239-R121]|uniref:LysR family transcriptional regulator n=1 Tax=Pelagibius sp. Alg239-R121 TaxID=2993448 RepID=UPI0024A77848|nr:LysR family transcriptional regulator [Pelagibius sp. Alg239-R121]
MDLRNLKFFTAIADTGGVSSAARHLNTVQSNVTARLKDLERELGVELFYRTGKGMVLTSAGQVLQSYAWRLDRLSDEARQAMRDCAGEGGLLRIGAMETTAAIRLPMILKRLQTEQPKLEVQVTAGPTETLLYELLAYRLDGAFVAGDQTHGELVGEQVFAERLVLVRPVGREPRRRSDTPEQLIVFRRGCSYRLRSEAWLRDQGQLPFRVMEFGTLDGILGCVAAGLGVTLLPEAVISASSFAGDLETESLPKRFSELPTYFVRRKDSAPKRNLDAFLTAVRKSSTLKTKRASPVPKRSVG